MEIKKSRTGLHLIVGVLFGIIICVGVIFAIYELGYLTFSDTEEKVDSDNDNTNNNEQTKEDTSAISLDFDTSKVINGNENIYRLVNNNNTIYITLDETRKIVTLNYNRKILSDKYGLNWDTTGIDENIYENKQITFEKEIKDVCFGLIGQDTADYILFLMEDGTVEYIPLYQALSTNGTDGLVSYGVLQGIEDVVKFYTAYAIVGMTGNYSTIIAQTKDGTLYDLSPIINNTSDNQ